MNVRAAVASLCLGAALVFGASDAKAFGFGLLGGCGGGCDSCCEPVCCEPVCCDPCCAPKCGLLSGLKGMFHRHSCCETACCDPCCAAEPSCCVEEPSCCAAEPSCEAAPCCEAAPACCEPACCDPCCAPRRCRILDGLKGLFQRGCCAPACGCDCCVEEVSCGCEAAPSCGC
ncbi:MAG: hypothetical protein ACRCT8_00515 [Lacipirellulaceae bacterium]